MVRGIQSQRDRKSERQNQQPRDRIIGHNKFLGVEPGGGPENQDDKMIRGVYS
jgi:hypothetical protein